MIKRVFSGFNEGTTTEALLSAEKQMLQMLADFDLLKDREDESH